MIWYDDCDHHFATLIDSMNIVEKLHWRYAVQKFSTEKLPEDKVMTVLSALSLTPSSFGLQPWKFVLVENQEIREELLHHAWKQRQIVDASHLLILCRLETVTHADIDKYIASIAGLRGVQEEDLAGFSRSIKKTIGSFTDEQQAEWITKQIYIALGTFLTVCAVEHVDACPMEGFLAREFDKVLGLDEKGLRSVVVVPFGYRADDDKHASHKKVRYTLEEILIKI